MAEFLNSLKSQVGQQQAGVPGEQVQQQQEQGGFMQGLLNKAHGAAGGGPESEKNEDGLDKAIDFVQEKFLGAGPQSNESAIEQAKDEQISDFIRGQYKGKTGKDFPIADKERSQNF